MLWRPRALLLDFGGVIVEYRGEAGPAETFASAESAASDAAQRLSRGVALRLYEIVGGAVPLDVIEADFAAGDAAYSQWRDAMARPHAPTELTHAQFWSDFVCADWPEPARAAVLARAGELAYAVTALGPGWGLRDGVTEVLDAADAAGIPVVVVSNTFCGAAFRDFLDRSGVGGRFAAQFYSDEVGVRKPNPALVRAATDHLGVAPGEVWFVGDTPLRDILAARRAGVGLAVLVRSQREVGTGWPHAVPDATVESMVDVHRMLAGVTGS